MKAQCPVTHPEFLYEDGQYTACSSCKNRCEDAIRCIGCGKIEGVFYKSRGYDLCLCRKCYEEEEAKRARAMRGYRPWEKKISKATSGIE